MDQAALTQYIEKHLHIDPNQLLLSKSLQQDGVDVKIAALQIACLQRIKTKVPQWYRPDIRFAHLVSVEQCSSEPTAIYKASFVKGKRVLDLSGGLGIDSAFMARDAKSLVYVEPNAALVTQAIKNFSILGLQNITCVKSTAEDFLATYSGTFDLIYLDPDRRNPTGKRVAGFADCSPDIIPLLETLLDRAEHVLIKASPMLDISLACKQLQQVEQIHVVGWQDECKELLFMLGKKCKSVADIPIIAVALDSAGMVISMLESSQSAEANAKVEYALPETYLYDPPAIILKSGAVALLAKKYHLKKLHANTHMFTSKIFVQDVPGRSFVLEAVISAQISELKRYLPEGKANLRARNFPQTTEVLQRKLKVKDGGDVFLFAVTLADESRKILVCKRTDGQSPSSK